jgi:hypothetical protein
LVAAAGCSSPSTTSVACAGVSSTITFASSARISWIATRADSWSLGSIVSRCRASASSSAAIAFG